jgi:hypothetical protein
VHYSYYQELHNTYQTIKGNGKFEVRHVLKGNSTIPFQGSTFPNFVEIKFINNYYSFFESVFGDVGYKNYLGEIIINNTKYKDCHYEYKNFDEISKNIGIFSNNFGLFQTIDSITSMSYLLLNK